MSDLQDRSLEELEAMMADPENIMKVTPEPEPQPEPEPPAPEPETTVAPEPEPEPEPQKEEAPIEAAPPVEVETDHAAQLEHERREAIIQKLMLHNSRLAGKVGHLEKLVSRPQTERDHSPEIDDERVTELQNRLEQMESAQRAEARTRVVAEELRTVLERPYLKGIPPEFIQSAVQTHSQAWEEAIAENDPDLARLGARTVLLTVAADARRMQAERSQSQAVERKAEQTRKLSEAKVKASISGAGSALTPKEPEKSLRERSVKELAALLDQMTG